MVSVKEFWGTWFRGGGLVVALVGFGVTRLFVAESILVEKSTTFVLASGLSLVVGLALTVYGVVLAVGSFSREYVAVVTRWCLLGVGGMVLVLVLSSSRTLASAGPLALVAASPALVGNALLGGAVGGVLVGTRSARNRCQRRELRRRTNQARLVNRLLRHEVVNAATITRGYASTLADLDDVGAASDAIRVESQRIVDTIREVGEVTTESTATGGVDIAGAVHRETRTARECFDGATVTYDGPESGVVVHTDGDFDIAIRNLLAYAIDDADARSVEVNLTEHEEAVALSTHYDGRALSERERRLLVDAEFPEYDDPKMGFRLGIVRLLVTRANGRVETRETDGRTTVEVRVPRADTLPGVGETIAVTRPKLGRAMVAGVLAGVVMGGYVQATSDTMAVIGALYGVESQLVSWTTHLFHSVVFAVLFAAGCSHERFRRFAHGAGGSTVSGVAWGAVLWLFAAGVVMPLWLRLVGVPAALPNVSLPGLVSHLLWGGVLGLSYATLDDDWFPTVLSGD
jgi:uncharacterized membrane protein YagU involved in acid resistance